MGCAFDKLEMRLRWDRVEQTVRRGEIECLTHAIIVIVDVFIVL
jgi:hypothetical protein